MTAVTPTSMASRHMAASNRVAMPSRRHPGSTDSVVTWPSVPTKSIAAESHHLRAHLGHQVAPVLGTGKLPQEEAERPASRLGLVLDAQDAAQVPAPHGRDHELGSRPEITGVTGHPPSRVDQLISASGLRRYSGVSSQGFTHCSRSAWA